MKIIRTFIIAALLGVGFTSCSEDDLNPTSIFDSTTEPVRNEFDQWIWKNYTEPYNIELKYRFDDKESDMDYNVIPADYNKSIALAKLVKYLWMEVYEKLAGKEFLCTYCPKIFHFVGSPEYEKSGGSMVLGTAEGGLKITLFNVNALNVSSLDPEILNEWYFKTMHHEFSHILHQTKNYSTDFNDITAGKYYGAGWVNINDATARRDGFVTAYASSAVDEDFVETIANYIVKSDAEWQQILNEAVSVDETGNPDYSGRDAILRKLEMVTQYLADSWGLDIQALHEEVQERDTHIDELDLVTLN